MLGESEEEEKPERAASYAASSLCPESAPAPPGAQEPSHTGFVLLEAP